jgi:hypothetical protein
MTATAMADVDEPSLEEPRGKPCPLMSLPDELLVVDIIERCLQLDEFTGLGSVSIYTIRMEKRKGEDAERCKEEDTKTGALASLALTCRKLNRIVTPLLYRTVRLGQQANVLYFLRTLLESNRHAKLVRHAAFYAEEAWPDRILSWARLVEKNRSDDIACFAHWKSIFASWKPDALTEEDLETKRHALLCADLPVVVDGDNRLQPYNDSHKFVPRGLPYRATAIILLLATDLRTIMFSGYTEDPHRTDTMISTLHVAHDHELPVLPKLEEFRYQIGDDFGSMNIPNVMQLFPWRLFARRVKIFSTNSICLKAAPEDFPVSRPLAFKSLRTLRLLYTSSSPADLCRILGQCSDLERVDILYRARTCAERQREFTSALAKHSRHSLGELSVRWDIDEDEDFASLPYEMGWSGFQASGYADFTNLTTITVDLFELFGPLFSWLSDEDTAGLGHRIVPLLPRSLVALHLCESWREARSLQHDATPETQSAYASAVAARVLDDLCDRHAAELPRLARVLWTPAAPRNTTVMMQGVLAAAGLRFADEGIAFCVLGPREELKTRVVWDHREHDPWNCGGAKQAHQHWPLES